MTGIMMEASALMRDVAAPYSAGDKIKAAIERARKRVSRQLHDSGYNAMNYGRAKRVWKGEARRIDGFEMDALRAAKAERERIARAAITANALAIASKNKQSPSFGDICNELATALASFAALREALSKVDADFYSQDIARISGTISRLRDRLDDEGSAAPLTARPRLEGDA